MRRVWGFRIEGQARWIIGPRQKRNQPIDDNKNKTVTCSCFCSCFCFLEGAHVYMYVNRMGRGHKRALGDGKKPRAHSEFGRNDAAPHCAHRRHWRPRRDAVDRSTRPFGRDRVRADGAGSAGIGWIRSIQSARNVLLLSVTLSTDPLTHTP